jgi:hypothetical protein
MYSTLGRLRFRKLPPSVGKLDRPLCLPMPESEALSFQPVANRLSAACLFSCVGESAEDTHICIQKPWHTYLKDESRAF